MRLGTNVSYQDTALAVPRPQKGSASFLGLNRATAPPANAHLPASDDSILMQSS
jgi:hypothetical protein